MTDKALRNALDVLEKINQADMDKDFLTLYEYIELDGAIDSIRAALAQQPAEGVVPEGYALVPKRLTREMDEVMQEDGWQWEDLLAAANAITAQEYDAISTPPAQAQGEPVFWYRPRSDGCYDGPIHKDSIEDVRKQSGAWIPLAAIASQQEPQK